MLPGYSDLDYDEKKEVYWNHFVSSSLRKAAQCPSFTDRRLKLLKEIIWNDREFWGDIFHRHSGLIYSPEEYEKKDSFFYNHCMGNFSGMLIQTMIRNNHIFKLRELR